MDENEELGAYLGLLSFMQLGGHEQNCKACHMEENLELGLLQ